MLFWVTYPLVVLFAFPLYIFIYSARASIQKGHKSMRSLSAVNEGATYLLFPPSQYFPCGRAEAERSSPHPTDLERTNLSSREKLRGELQSGCLVR